MATHPSVTYKRLTQTDVPNFRKLNELFARAFADPETHLSRLPSDPYLRSLLSKDHIIALAAFHDEVLVGGLYAYVLEKYEQQRSEIYIYDLAVAEEHRRQGIARALIEELKTMARQAGAWVIFVQADREDAAAVALYQSMGIPEEPLHLIFRLKERLTTNFETKARRPAGNANHKRSRL